MYSKRTLEPFLKKASNQFPIILVTGPRQVGKTTFMQHCSEPSRTYVTLDDPNLRELAVNDPQLFFQRFSPPLLIDEVQYAPELFPVLKMIVDKQKKPGLFWLTGSQRFHLMQNITESLAGRVGIINLLGMSNSEIIATESHSPFLPINLLKSNNGYYIDSLSGIYQKMWRGSFPAIALNTEIDRDLFYSSYIQTYLQRDVMALTKIGDAGAFYKFLRSAAARTSQLLNLSDMARDAEISPATAKQWLSILETSGIIYLLEPYHNNLFKRMVKRPMLYFVDTGLAAYLTGWTSPDTLEAGAFSGAVFETFVLSEIVKSYWHNGKEAPLFYYRDKDKKEIDVLIVSDNTIYPVEIKKSAAPSKKMIKNFKVLDKFTNFTIGHGAVICLCKELLPITQRVSAVPVGMI